LNKLGDEKWELAAVDAVPPGVVSMYLFKRPAGSSRRAEAPAPQAQPEARREARPDEYRIYRLKSANAADLAAVLQKLFQGREEKVLRIVAEPTTNSLLTAGNPEQQDTVRTLIEQLDVLTDVKAEPKRK
jgi:type II secretory pathway component GspD/PulD (secretin)